MSLFAGAAGTLAVEASERVERGLLGELPVYAARRLFGGEAPGALLRWVYGPLLGFVAGHLLRRRRLEPVTQALAIAVTVCAFELVALPASGATPQLRQWPKSHLVLLPLHTLAFGAGFTWAQRR